MKKINSFIFYIFSIINIGKVLSIGDGIALKSWTSYKTMLTTKCELQQLLENRLKSFFHIKSLSICMSLFGSIRKFAITLFQFIKLISNILFTFVILTVPLLIMDFILLHAFFCKFIFFGYLIPRFFSLIIFSLFIFTMELLILSLLIFFILSYFRELGQDIQIPVRLFINHLVGMLASCTIPCGGRIVAMFPIFIPKPNLPHKEIIKNVVDAVTDKETNLVLTSTVDVVKILITPPNKFDHNPQLVKNCVNILEQKPNDMKIIAQYLPSLTLQTFFPPNVKEEFMSNSSIYLSSAFQQLELILRETALHKGVIVLPKSETILFSEPYLQNNIKSEQPDISKVGNNIANTLLEFLQELATAQKGDYIIKSANPGFDIINSPSLYFNSIYSENLDIRKLIDCYCYGNMISHKMPISLSTAADIASKYKRTFNDFNNIYIHIGSDMLPFKAKLTINLVNLSPEETIEAIYRIQKRISDSKRALNTMYPDSDLPILEIVTYKEWSNLFNKDIVSLRSNNQISYQEALDILFAYLNKMFS